MVLKFNLPSTRCCLYPILYIKYLSLIISRREEHLLKDTDQHMKTVCDNDSNDGCGDHPSDKARVDKGLGHGQDASAYAAFKKMH